MNKKYAIIGIVVAFGILIGTTIFLSLNSVTKAEGTFQNKEESLYYTYSGNIDADSKQNCVSTNGLSIKKFYVEEGDYVKKGELLYLLDDSDVAATLAQAAAGVELARINYEKARTTGQTQTVVQTKASYETAKASYNDASVNLERMKALFDTGAISQSDLEQATTAFTNIRGQYETAKSAYEMSNLLASQNIAAAKAQYDQAKAGYDAAQTGINKRRITADISGVVTDIWVKEHSTITTGTKIMDVVDYDSLILPIKVDQFEINQFILDEEVEVYINPLDRMAPGKVSKISNQAIKTGELSNFVVNISIDHSEDIKLGLLAEIRVSR